MTTAKSLRKLADRCAALAQQTLDDDARRRYLRLEQKYLLLAEAETDAQAAPVGSAA